MVDKVKKAKPKQRKTLPKKCKGNCPCKKCMKQTQHQHQQVIINGILPQKRRRAKGKQTSNSIGSHTTIFQTVPSFHPNVFSQPVPPKANTLGEPPKKSYVTTSVGTHKKAEMTTPTEDPILIISSKKPHTKPVMATPVKETSTVFGTPISKTKDDFFVSYANYDTLHPPFDDEEEPEGRRDSVPSIQTTYAPKGRKPKDPTDPNRRIRTNEGEIFRLTSWFTTYGYTLPSQGDMTNSKYKEHLSKTKQEIVSQQKTGYG
jgi:hypothetical protein